MNLKKWKPAVYVLVLASFLTVSGPAAGSHIIGLAAQAPSEDEQKAMFSDGILDVGAYGYRVPDGYGWGPGADNIPMRCSLKKGGQILVEVRPTEDPAKAFFDNFQQQKETLERFAHKELGPELTEITFDTVQDASGREIPVIRITSARQSHILKATICYRRENTYMAEFIGIDDSGNEALDSATVQAAQSFTDFGGQAHSLSVKPETPLGSADWPYPYFHNPFAVARYYFDAAYPPPTAPSRRSTDYDLDFASVAIEALVRGHLQNDKFDTPLRSSDLDAFTYLRLEEGTGTQMYSGSVTSRKSTRFSFPCYGTTVDTLEDLKEFRNLAGIWLNLPNVSDFSPIGNLGNLKQAVIMPGGGMKDVSWLAPLSGLEQLTMWGGSFPEITDISPMKSLTSLKTLHMLVPSVKDVSPLAGLPNLESVTLVCSAEADLQPLIDAPQIKTLVVNAQTLKGE